MTRNGGSRIATGAVALALLLGPAAAAAQSVDSYRLPGATVRPAPGAQGPVDREVPVVTTAAPRPAPTPTPTATQPPATAAASPQPSAQPATTSAPPSRTTAPAQRQAGPAAAPTSSPAAQPQALPGGTPPPATNPAFPAGLPTVAPPATPPVTAANAAAPGWYWPWLAGAAALIAAVFAMLWWRRNREASPLAITFEPPVVSPQQSETPAGPEPAPQAPAAPALEDRLPQPQPGLNLANGLAIELESRRMNASLVATTLSYVLRVTNTGDRPLTGLAIAGDMIAAHASLPPEAQLANARHRLEPRHALPALAPGESAELAGDFRLPLTAINPIRAGSAAYFVPLARLRVEAALDGAAPLVHLQTWVIGELPEAEGAALKPFRLDLGPRTYSRVGQRAVN